jgi:hypothetical protein
VPNITFHKKTGGISLGELIEGAGLASPFNEGALLEVAANASATVSEIEKVLF